MLHHHTFIKSQDCDWVVFVHGAGGSSRIWAKQLEDFKAAYNVLLLDLRGHGESQNMIKDLIEGPYTFESIAKDVIYLLEYLKIPKAHFVGISLGTIIIRTIAELRSDMVQSMILGGAITRLKISSRILIKMAELTKQFVPYMWLYRLMAFIIMPKKNHEKSRYIFIREAKKIAQKEFLRWFKLTNDVNPLLKFFKEKEIATPTLYIMGAEDHMFLKPVKEMAQKHHSAFLQIIDNCGHVCNVEAPNYFNNMALSFLSEHKATP